MSGDILRVKKADDDGRYFLRQKISIRNFVILKLSHPTTNEKIEVKKSEEV